MADTGWVVCGTGANDASYGTADWSSGSVANITADDGSDAVTSNFSNTTTNYLKGTNFGLAIPTGATIDGIEVRPDLDSLIASTATVDRVRLVDETGTIGTTDRAGGESISTTEQFYTFGGPSDLWGDTWSETDVENSNFGYVVAASRAGGNTIVYSDVFTIKVYYTESGGVTGTGSPSLPAVTASGAGVVEKVGTGAATLAAATLAGEGTITKTGTGALSFAAVTAEGAGTVGAEITGTGALTGIAVTASGAGAVVKTGAGVLTNAAITTAGVGEIAKTGTGVAALPAFTVSGAGAVGAVVSGSGAFNLAAFAAAGAGTIIKTATGVANLPGFTSSGAGVITRTGTGANVLPTFTLAGSGSVVSTLTGTGAFNLQAITASGTGTAAAPTTPDWEVGATWSDQTSSAEWRDANEATGTFGRHSSGAVFR